MRRALAMAVALAAGATTLAAQQVGKKLRMSVADFNYKNVRQSAEELFGGGTDVGKALADLVSQQLPSCARYDVGPRGNLPEPVAPIRARRAAWQPRPAWTSCSRATSWRMGSRRDRDPA